MNVPGSTNPLSYSGEMPKSPQRSNSSPTPIKIRAHKPNKTKDINLPIIGKPFSSEESNLKDTPRTERIKQLNGAVFELLMRTQILEGNSQFLKGENDTLKERLIGLQNQVNEIVTEELTSFDPGKRDIPEGMYS